MFNPGTKSDSFFLVGPRSSFFSATLPGGSTFEITTARVPEFLIYGDLFAHAVAQCSRVAFYPPELEPDLAGASPWAQLTMVITDAAVREEEWSGSGILIAEIGFRKSGSNVYGARDVADQLSTAFVDNAVEIDEGGETLGYAVFGKSRSESSGESGGIIRHHWEAGFVASSASWRGLQRA